MVSRKLIAQVAINAFIGLVESHNHVSKETKVDEIRLARMKLRMVLREERR